MIHTLKIWPEYYKHVLDGTKTFEVRKNDRCFKLHDIVILKEYNLDTGYTGRFIYAEIMYILDGKLAIPAVSIFSFRLLNQEEEAMISSMIENNCIVEL